jgi:hypothetical protein
MKFVDEAYIDIMRNTKSLVGPMVVMVGEVGTCSP